jgi:hypothetical protein
MPGMARFSAMIVMQSPFDGNMTASAKTHNKPLRNVADNEKADENAKILPKNTIFHNFKHNINIILFRRFQSKHQIILYSKTKPH